MADDININSDGFTLGSNKVQLQQAKNLNGPKSQDPGKPFKDLATLLSRFARLKSSEKDWRKDKAKWQRYYDGEQLTAEQKGELNKRNQPPIVINKIAPRVDLVVGLMSGNRFRMKAFPRNASDDDMTGAQAVNAGLRFIEENNNQKYEESEVFEDGLITGKSWFEVTTSMNDEFELDVLVKSRDSDDIFVDPGSVRYDLNDAKDIADSMLVHKEDLIAIYPDFEKEINMAFQDGPLTVVSTTKHAGDDYLFALLRDEKNAEMFIDKKNERLRLTKYWFRTREMRKFAVTKKGIERLPRNVSKSDERKIVKEIERVTGEKPEVMSLMTDIVRVQTFIPTAILENKEPEFLGDSFPYVNYLVKKDKKRNSPYGLVKPMIDPQDEINKRRSKALHALNTERIIYEEGAVDDEEVLKNEVARPDGIIKRNRGFELAIDSNRELGSSQLQLYQAANTELNDVTGVSPDLMGSVTNARSQDAIAQRQRQSLAVLNRAFENWKRTRLLLEKLKLKFMQEFWNGPKVINITDDEGKVKNFPLNVTYRDTKDGQLKKLNDITTGKYDIVFEETPESVNFMEEVFLELAKLSQTGQIDPELIMEFAPVPKEVRDRLLGRMRELKAQQQEAELQKAAVESGQLPAADPGQQEEPVPIQ